MSRQDAGRITRLYGSLELLILRILVFGRQHGQGIAHAIEQQAGDSLLVDHGSLYPALQRLEAREWVSAEWGVSESNRKARFYTLTKAGKKQLTQETRQWRRLVASMTRILGPEEV
jgi:transcriptional regulator